MSTQCKYQPIRSLGEIPDSVVLNCKWISNGSSTYDKAYKLNGFWYLVWNDEAMKHPNAIQCRRTAIEETNTQITKDLLLVAVDNELLLRQEIMDQREHIQMLERERNEARQLVKELTHENENLYRRLESVHEVYRLSSVCR